MAKSFDLQGSVEMGFEPSLAYEYVADASKASRCLPDTEHVEVLDADRIRLRLRMGAGPFRASFDALFTYTERVKGDHVVIRGVSTSHIGRLEATVTLRVRPAASGCVLEWRAQGEISGAASVVGSEQVEAAVAEMVQKMASCMKSQLEAAK